jgi:23S rRNA A2030 N6-methylase RlmJ
MMKPTSIVNGRVVGLWKRSTKQERALISIEPFRELKNHEYQLVARAVERYGRFHNTTEEFLR